MSAISNACGLPAGWASQGKKRGTQNSKNGISV